MGDAMTVERNSRRVRGFPRPPLVFSDGVIARSVCLLLVLIASSVNALGGGDEDISMRIDERAIAAFCDTVFPLELKGKKRVGITVLGKAVSQEMPWAATVSSPKVDISRKEQTFVAEVDVQSAGLKWRGEVAGTLKAAYDAERKSIVISVADAVVPVTVGPLQVAIDVAKEVPELPFAFPLPEITLPVQGKTVRVVATPDVGFEEGAVVVTASLSFETEPAGGSKQSRSASRRAGQKQDE